MESWQILLHIAACKGWDIQQIDVKTAFLYGLLPDNETQCMQQPVSFEEPGKETWVWRLKRGLYGMKQSGRIWNKTMNEAMLSWALGIQESFLGIVHLLSQANRRMCHCSCTRR